MYTALVLVEQNGNNYLFQAPAWSSIDIGDTVVVDTSRGEQTGKVKDVMNWISTDDKSMKFILNCCGAKLPLRKVLGRLEYVECRYLNEEEEDGEHSEE